MSKNFIPISNQSLFYPLKYFHGITPNIILQNVLEFFSLNDIHIKKLNKLLLSEKREITDLNIKISEENFKNITINLNYIWQLILMKKLQILLFQRFKSLAKDINIVQKSELSDSKLNNNDCIYYEKNKYDLSNLTINPYSIDLINFFHRNMKNKIGNLFYAIVLDDTEIPCDFDKDKCIFGISVLTKIYESVNLTTYIKDNNTLAKEKRIEILNQIYEILSLDDPEYKSLLYINPDYLLIDTTSKLVYLNVLQLLKTGKLDDVTLPPPENEKSIKSKVWTFGLISYLVLTGKKVFENKTQYQNYINNTQKLELKCDKELESVIRNCLEINPDKRMSLADCIDKITKNINVNSSNSISVSQAVTNATSSNQTQVQTVKSATDFRNNLKTSGTKDFKLKLLKEINTKISVGKIEKVVDRNKDVHHLYSNAWNCMNYQTSNEMLKHFYNEEMAMQSFRKESYPFRVTCSRSYGNLLFQGFSDGQAMKIYFENKQPRFDKYDHPHDSEVTSIVFKEKSKVVLTSGMDGKIRKYVSEDYIEDLITAQDSITCMEQYDLENRNLLFACSYEIFYLFDFSASDEVITSSKMHHQDAFIVSLTYIPSKKLIVTGDYFGFITIWKLDMDENFDFLINFVDKIHRSSEYITQTIYLEVKECLLINSRKNKNQESKTEYIEIDKNDKFKITEKRNYLAWTGVTGNMICNYIYYDVKENQLIYGFAENKMIFYEII